jgi:hypothetical protein
MTDPDQKGKQKIAKKMERPPLGHPAGCSTRGG